MGTKSSSLGSPSLKQASSTPQRIKKPYTNGDRNEARYIVRPPLIATSDVAKISISEDPLVVQVSLTDDGAKKFTTATTGMKGKRLAVIVQGRIVSAPLLQDAPLGRSFEFSGFKDAAEAKVFVEAFNKKKG
jgi:preprotein translocase subunit SecD